MTTSPAPRAFRAVPLVLGSVVAVVALALAAAGGFVLWIDETQRDADGYVTTPTEIFGTSTHALVSEAAHVEVGAPDWIFGPDRLGAIRVHATGPHGLPVFVGVGPAADVEAYLAGVRHDEVTELGYRPFAVDYRRHDGGAPATPPGDQTFWVASAQGTGEQVVSWRPADGDWRVVVLNPDGSAGVEAHVRFAAPLAFLDTLGWSLLAVALVLLATGAALVAFGARPPAAPPAAPAVTDPPPPDAPPARELVGVGAHREEPR